MSKFKIGDHIEPIERGTGFENSIVAGIYTETKGINKGKEMYRLKILCGTATIPVSSEINYKLVKVK